MYICMYVCIHVDVYVYIYIYRYIYIPSYVPICVTIHEPDQWDSQPVWARSARESSRGRAPPSACSPSAPANLERGSAAGVSYTYPGVSNTYSGVSNTHLGVSSTCPGVSYTRPGLGVVGVERLHLLVRHQRLPISSGKTLKTIKVVSRCPAALVFLSSRTYQTYGHRKSTPPQNRQLIDNYY